MAEWLDRDIWMILFEPLKENPKRADEATLIFDCLVDLIESGGEGTTLALAALENAIRILYDFTEESKLSYDRYRHSLKTGDPTDDEIQWLREPLIQTHQRT
ncbi:MAG: hypothetical protein DMF61_21500 [Blastocatellia bacterium AA13]|nr:MAG: hypothetical protein DMF61_21500 [Blastocatellia bacterium AA13]